MTLGRERVRASALDVLIAAAVVAAILLRIAVASEPAARQVDALAVALGMAAGALLVARRRFPLPVLLGTAGLVVLYHALGYPAIGLALPLAGAVANASLLGRTAWATGVPGALIGGALVFRLLFDQTESLLAVLNDTAQEAILVAALVLLGEAIRARRALLASVQERIRSAAAEREQQAQRRTVQERLRVAREIHDVVAHSVTVMTVQADVASAVLADDPARAQQALSAIRSAGDEAIGELQTTVNLLRDGTAARSPASGLAVLDDLLETLAGSGLDVSLSVCGRRRALPAAIDLAAYRILQESLTNVLRHAAEPTARVTLTYSTAELVLSVRNRIGAGARREGAGHGISGMAERAAALGGLLWTGARETGEFEVVAHLPLAP